MFQNRTIIILDSGGENLRNLNEILNYYIEGIMKEYSITDRKRAEGILANALQNEKADIAITDIIEQEIEQ